MKWVPHPGRLIVLIDQSESPIELLEDTRKQMQLNSGLVVNVGNQELVPVYLGRRIMFTPFSGQPVTIEGADHRVLQPEDVLLFEQTNAPSAPPPQEETTIVPMGEWLVTEDETDPELTRSDHE